AVTAKTRIAVTEQCCGNSLLTPEPNSLNGRNSTSWNALCPTSREAFPTKRATSYASLEETQQSRLNLVQRFLQAPLQTTFGRRTDSVSPELKSLDRRL